MPSLKITDYPWFDRTKEEQGKAYVHAIRGVMGASTVLLYFYPFAALIATAFLIDSPAGLAAMVCIYWAAWVLLAHRRYSIDSDLRGLEVTFKRYLLGSPVGISYWKYSFFTMIVIAGTIFASKFSFTWYEATVAISLFLGAVYLIMYRMSWNRTCLKDARPMENPALSERLGEIADQSGMDHVTPLVADGKSFGIANAFCVGIFRPKMVITDYLMENLTEEETAAILSHEMGHMKYRDTFKRGISPLLAFLAVIVMIVIVGVGYAGYLPIPPVTVLFPNFILVWVVILFAGVMIPGMFMVRRSEERADGFAAEHNDPQIFISALGKTRFLNGLPVFWYMKKGVSLLSRIARIEKRQNSAWNS